MSPDGGKCSEHFAVFKQIVKDFGSFDKFVMQVETMVTNGWVWLCMDGKGKLDFTRLLKGCPRDGLQPVLCVNVWYSMYNPKEKHKEKERAQYMSNVVSAINWNKVNERFEAASMLL